VLESVAGIGTCCSATSLGSSGGGSDWVPDMVDSYQPGRIMLNNNGLELGLGGGVEI
jgi:hypothetical protein